LIHRSEWTVALVNDQAVFTPPAYVDPNKDHVTTPSEDHPPQGPPSLPPDNQRVLANGGVPLGFAFVGLTCELFEVVDQLRRGWAGECFDA
jgi:hypothetical protein